MTTRNTISSEISTTALEAMAVRFTAVATLTLWVSAFMGLDMVALYSKLSLSQIYEYILTLDKEISLFWPSKLSAIKALFFANRYLPIIVSINNVYFLIFNSNENIHLCRPAAISIGFLSFAGFVLAEIVLVIRLYVVWVARKSILMIAVSLLIVNLNSVLMKDLVSPVLIFASGCEGVFEVRTEWVALLLIFTFEIVILSLMLIAMRAHLQQNNSELVGILLRDVCKGWSIMYSALVCSYILEVKAKLEEDLKPQMECALL
ncbi:hypothetical protein PNOK_0702800 [Pyrrhoderma noxium]|uniref:DUF6533 domain-containing protein n=1 Tax=Pyrrhoderma noxium TaxID=2282107 RepID=A0A286UBQ7_9AGAM|nr:hypothetical protein PNOK_0702800 [Pyrrhoderma noxium]